MAAMSVAGTAMQVVGTLQQGAAAKDAGKAQQKALNYSAKLKDIEAKHKDIKAGQERAVSQRKAIEETKRKELIESSFIARNALAGGGSFDPNSVDTLSDIESEGRYRVLAALYEGENSARTYEYGAQVDRAQADADRYAGEVAYQQGKAAKKRATTMAIAQGFLGMAQAAYLGRGMMTPKTTAMGGGGAATTASATRIGGGGAAPVYM